MKTQLKAANTEREYKRTMLKLVKTFKAAANQFALDVATVSRGGFEHYDNTELAAKIADHTSSWLDEIIQDFKMSKWN